MAENLSIQIDFSTLMDRCKMLSSYEGRDTYDANGKSSFDGIVIHSVDEHLVSTYIQQGVAHVRHVVEDMLLGVEAITDGEQWTFRTDQRRYYSKGLSNIKKNIDEAISAYVMAQWLGGRKDDRVAFYNTLYQNEIVLISDNIFSKSAPKRPNYRPQ